MIDIKLLRQDPERFKRAAQNKRVNCDIDALVALDDRRRALQQEVDQLKFQQNEIGGQIALYKNPKSKWYQQALADGRTDAELKAEGQKLVEQTAELKNKAKDLEVEFKEVSDRFDAALLTAPQPPADEVPLGKDESENVEVRRIGEVRKLDFEPKDHVVLMTNL